MTELHNTLTANYWLLAFGAGASSNYSNATVISAKDKQQAIDLGVKVAARELEGERGGRSVDVERIGELGVRGTSLYASRLHPEARVMVDVHWERPDVIASHWETASQDGSRNPVIARQRG